MPDGASPALGIALDIGTTTVAGKLLDLESGTGIASFSELNSQLPFGTDVISRISRCLHDSSKLSNLISAQLDQAVKTLLHEAGCERSSVKRMVIAGNTAMTYILLNLPCRSLGFAPSGPEYLYKTAYSYEEIFHTSTLDCDCLVFPFISSSIGGDVVAGLCALGDTDDFILMDLGTSSELFYAYDEIIFCTSVTTGSAFEGGGIECGSGGIVGAISKVNLKNDDFDLVTIGSAEPISLCGSGLLDLIAELAREGIIDADGRLDPTIRTNRIDLTDTVYLSEKDIRQFQMTKGAIRSGLDIVLAEMGDRLPSQLFLAGGFGQNLDEKNAADVGLIPYELVECTHSIGNGSLSGAVKACLEPAVTDKIMDKAVHATEINLATHWLFETLFTENRSFWMNMERDPYPA